MSEQRPKPSFFTRAMIPIVTSRAGASFFRRVMHRIDVPLLRLTGGRFSFASSYPVLLLTTTGAKSGKPRPIPLAYVEVEGRLLVMASMGGAHVNPPWFHNLVSHPEVTVELGGDRFDARAVLANGADRDDLFRKVCKLQPLFADYQARTDRQIPVFELKRLS